MDTLMRVLTFSLPAGRIMGIPLRINWLILLFLPMMIRPYLGLTKYGLSGPYALAIGLMFVAILYGSVLLHELGHCWGTRLVGNTIHEIQLTPLGGIAVGEGPNASPRTELIVVGLGPAVSVLLCGVGYVFSFVVGRMNAPLMLKWAAEWVFEINLMLALFNLLTPIFPLDSAKLLRAALSLKFDPQKVTYYLAQFGMWAGILVIAAGIFGLSLPFLGGGTFLMLIMFVAVQVCAQMLQYLKYENVYSTHDRWGTRPVYYDNDQMRMAANAVQEDLKISRFAFWARRKRPTKPDLFERPKPAKRVRNIEPMRVLVASPNPDQLDDRERIAELMQAAAEAEDFVLAARLKKRLEQLERFETTK